MFFLLTADVCSAQTFTLTGTVTDSREGKAIPGAIVRQGTVGTATDDHGRYSLNLPFGEHDITFSHTSYSDQVHHLVQGSAVVVELHVVLTMKSQWLTQVVVSTGKFDQKRSDVTVSMEVIRPDFINASNNTNIEQTLDRIPGVGVIDGQPNIRCGAGYSYGAGTRVLVLVDGLPFLSGDAGFPSWGFLPIENVSQIEVIKGAASALYGSAAMNGVINLRTAYPTAEPVTHINYFSGVYQNPRDNITDKVNRIRFNIVDGDTLGADTTFIEKAWWGDRQPVFTGFSASHRQKIGRFDLVTGTFWISEDNHRMGDFNRRGRFHLNTRYRTKKPDGLSVGINSTIERTRNGTFFLWNGSDEQMYLPLPNTVTGGDGHKFTFDPFITYFGPKGTRHKLLSRWYRNFNRTDRDQSTLSDLYYGEYQFQHSFDSAGLVVTSGIAGTYADVEAELYTRDSFFTTNSGIYLQLDKKMGQRLNLSGGARYEMNKLDTVRESRPVFRVGANCRVGAFSYLRASYGQGYRFPTMAEKFVETNVGLLSIFPNPNLKSETGWTAEIGFMQGVAFSRWEGFADVAFFWQQYRDMMEFTYGGEHGNLAGFQSINVGETRIAGVDVSVAGTGKIGPIPLDLMAGYTYADPVFMVFDSATDFHSSADYNVLKYRFRHTAKWDAETHCGRFYFGLAGRYYSFMEAMDWVFVVFIPGIEEFREENNTGDWVLDARVGLKLSDDARVWFIVSNLLNNEYTIRPALIEAPRNFVVRLSYDVKWKKQPLDPQRR